jgi:hypothetical protein
MHPQPCHKTTINNNDFNNNNKLLVIYPISMRFSLLHVAQSTVELSYFAHIKSPKQQQQQQQPLQLNTRSQADLCQQQFAHD